jgi:parallel beta-helix repeat protein
MEEATMQAAHRWIRPPSRLIALSATTSALVASALAFHAGPALADHVTCGDTVTADTTLDSDLIDCPNNGIVIGADGVTLDLNGHRIGGDGTEFADCPRKQICDGGVVIDGHDRIAVMGGSIREFAVGVVVFGAHKAEIVRISSSRNDFFGVVLGGSTRGEVRNGSFSHNVAPDGDGIGLFDSDHIKIAGNSIKDNPGPGIHIDGTDNLVKNNRLGKNGPSMLIDGDDNEVRHNRVVEGGGILVGPGDDNVIVANRVSRADDALSIEDGRGNLVARNVVIDSRGYGIRLGIGNPSIGGGHNIVRRNLVKRSADDGFRVFAKDGHSLLRRNVAIRAGDDGFAIRNHTTRLAGNRAVRSADLGIAAVAGVIDGGGNVARHNGDMRQCRHIAC